MATSERVRGCCSPCCENQPRCWKVSVTAPEGCCVKNFVEATICTEPGSFWHAVYSDLGTNCCQFTIYLDCDCEGYRISLQIGAFQGGVVMPPQIECEPFHFEADVPLVFDSEGTEIPFYDCGCGNGVVVHMVVTEGTPPP